MSKTMKQIAVLFLCGVCLFGCESKLQKKDKLGANPAMEGFDWEGSDPAAIELADSIMVAMGGRENWDKTRFISWDFFDVRHLVWDKFTGRVRIDSYADNRTYLINVNTDTGRVKRYDGEISNPDTVKKYVGFGKSIWINDSYWLVMPFKLKDKGVTLKYLGADTVTGTKKYHVLEVTFKEVGDTPQNKYRLYVDINTKLVMLWAYFIDASQEQPRWVRPWDTYQKYGDILLSADRSDGKGPWGVKVSETLPDSVFTKF